MNDIPKNFTNQRGQPITEKMFDAALDITKEYRTDITEMQTWSVLDIGLPYSLNGVSVAAKATRIAQWLIDLMLDSAIAAIE